MARARMREPADAAFAVSLASDDETDLELVDVVTGATTLNDLKRRLNTRGAEFSFVSRQGETHSSVSHPYFTADLSVATAAVFCAATFSVMPDAATETRRFSLLMQIEDRVAGASFQLHETRPQLQVTTPPALREQ